MALLIRHIKLNLHERWESARENKKLSFMVIWECENDKITYISSSFWNVFFWDYHCKRNRINRYIILTETKP